MFLFLIVCIAALALVMLAAIWGMNRATQLMAGNRHRSSVRRQRRPLLRDEETRRVLVDRLSAVRRDWAQR